MPQKMVSGRKTAPITSVKIRLSGRPPRRRSPESTRWIEAKAEGLGVFGECAGAGLGQTASTGTFTLIAPTAGITAEISASMTVPPLPTPRGRGSPGRCRGSRRSAIPRRGPARGRLQPRWRSPDRSRPGPARG